MDVAFMEGQKGHLKTQEHFVSRFFFSKTTKIFFLLNYSLEAKISIFRKRGHDKNLYKN